MIGEAGRLDVVWCTVPSAVVTVAMLMTLLIVITRVVAETGLAYSELQVAPAKPRQMPATVATPQPIPTDRF